MISCKTFVSFWYEANITSHYLCTIYTNKKRMHTEAMGKCGPVLSWVGKCGGLLFLPILTADTNMPSLPVHTTIVSCQGVKLLVDRVWACVATCGLPVAVSCYMRSSRPLRSYHVASQCLRRPTRRQQR